MGDTIAAIITPRGRGAVGTIRLSGPESKEVIRKVWKSDHTSVDNFITHRIYYGKILFLSTGRPVDDVLLSYMKGPRSYTGEDVVEISAHGSPRILRDILDQLISAGARIAEPGEYTKRAFLNGKMDLIQAEAVAQLIDANSTLSARIAEEQLSGRLSDRITEIKDMLREVTALIEATIDFPEEEERFIEKYDIEDRINGLLKKINSLISTYDSGKIISEGVKTVIAGPPNAGKSSLLNALLGSERAIVHHIPGTTRDTIEEEAEIDGLLFNFIDTAGIREAEEEVEEIGVEKSRKELGGAEIVLLVIDGHKKAIIDKKFLRELRAVKNLIVIFNKKDKGITISLKNDYPELQKRAVVEISALTGDGIKNLIDTIIQLAIGKDDLDEIEGALITSRRHFESLLSAQKSLKSAKEAILNRESAEFIALHLRCALNEIGQLTGEVTSDDLLNDIFSNFCIGK